MCGCSWKPNSPRTSFGWRRFLGRSLDVWETACRRRAMTGGGRPGRSRGGFFMWSGRWTPAALPPGSMNVLRHIDRERFQMDFLLVHDGPAGYAARDPEPGDLHHHLPRLSQALAIRRQLRQSSARGRGPYDVVHSHIFNFSGFVLKLAARHGVPVRIAHSHTDTRLKEASLGWHQRLWRAGYLGLTKRWIAPLCDLAPRRQRARGGGAVRQGLDLPSALGAAARARFHAPWACAMTPPRCVARSACRWSTPWSSATSATTCGTRTTISRSRLRPRCCVGSRAPDSWPGSPSPAGFAGRGAGAGAVLRPAAAGW